MNFSPYKPPFQILELSAKPLAVSNLTALRATGRFVSVHPLLRRYADGVWSFVCTVFPASTRSEVQPSEVWVTGLTNPVLVLEG